MFVALEVTQPKHKGLRGVLERIQARPVLEERQVSQASFTVLRILEGARRGFTWEEIEEITGRFASRMLLPDGVQAPADSRIRNLICTQYDNQILLHTACEVIQRTRMQLYKRILGIFDWDAQYTDWLPELLKYYTAIHVVTHKQKRYLQISEQMMQQMGAPVLVSESLSFFRECVLILAPDGIQTDGYIPKCPILGRNTNPLPVQFTVAQQLRVALPRSLLEMCPQGIDPHRLASALYEYEGMHQLPLIAQTLRINGKQSELLELVHKVCELENT